MYHSTFYTVQRHREGPDANEPTHTERGPGPSNTTLRHKPPHRPEPRPGLIRTGPGTKRSGQHGPETTQGPDKPPEEPQATRTSTPGRPDYTVIPSLDIHTSNFIPGPKRLSVSRRPAEFGKRSTGAQFFLRRLGRRNLTKKGSKIFPRTYFLCFTQKRGQNFLRHR